MGKVKIRAGESDDCDRCLGRSINYCNAHRKGADINLISTFCICRRYFRLLYLSSEDGVRKDLSGGTTVGATSRELVAIRVTREMVMLRMFEYCEMWKEAQQHGWLDILMSLQEPLSNLVCLSQELNSMEQRVRRYGTML